MNRKEKTGNTHVHFIERGVCTKDSDVIGDGVQS